MSLKRLPVACLASVLLASAAPIVLMPSPARADEGRDGRTCARHPHQRSTAQVLADHLAAFRAADAALLACDYAKDAALVMPGSITHGRAGIEAAFASFFALAGGNIQVTIVTSTIADDVALLEYRVASAHVVVGDGVDTFVIDDGLITVQTARLGDLAIQ